MGAETSTSLKQLAPCQTMHWLTIGGLLEPFSNYWRARNILPGRLKRLRRLGTWQVVKQQIRVQRTQD